MPKMCKNCTKLFKIKKLKSGSVNTFARYFCFFFVVVVVVVVVFQKRKENRSMRFRWRSNGCFLKFD